MKSISPFADGWFGAHCTVSTFMGSWQSQPKIREYPFRQQEAHTHTHARATERRKRDPCALCTFLYALFFKTISVTFFLYIHCILVFIHIFLSLSCVDSTGWTSFQLKLETKQNNRFENVFFLLKKRVPQPSPIVIITRFTFSKSHSRKCYCMVVLLITENDDDDPFDELHIRSDQLCC